MRAGFAGALLGASLMTLAQAATAWGALTLSLVTTASAPVYLTHAGDRRLFIVEQAGRIRIFDRDAGSLLATPFLDIASKVSFGGERGLFSLAFHPDFASNGFFYVDYTNLAGDTVIERYHVSANPNVADGASAAILLVIAQPFANHNGGQLQVGPRDGYLYIGMGDGGSAGDPGCLAQSRGSLLGKILRLDVRQKLGQSPFYGIPADNPFAGANDPAQQIPDEIWALGVRNPWRFSFDRANGDLYIGDVGQDTFEEVDLHRAVSPGGQNFGWNAMEGFHCFSGGACAPGTPTCNAPELTLPIYEYSHASGDCSITGGYVFRGAGLPELLGRYLFTDYCSGNIRTLQETSPGSWQAQTIAQATGSPTSFGEDVDGQLYLTSGNAVYRFVPTNAVPSLRSGGWPILALLLALAGVAALGRAPRRAPRS